MKKMTFSKKNVVCSKLFFGTYILKNQNVFRGKNLFSGLKTAQLIVILAKIGHFSCLRDTNTSISSRIVESSLWKLTFKEPTYIGSIKIKFQAELSTIILGFKILPKIIKFKFTVRDVHFWKKNQLQGGAAPNRRQKIG